MARTHKRCGGKGYIRLASGADGHCFGCCGTGVYVPVTAEQKAARDNWNRTYSAMAHMPRTFTTEGVRPMAFRSGVLAGLEALGEREPQRLTALYAAVDAGRLREVAVHLYRYSQEG